MNCVNCSTSVSIVLKRTILEHEKVTVMLSSCFFQIYHTCLQNNSSETNVVFTDFDVLFFQLLRQKKRRKFLKIKVLPLEHAFHVSEKIFHCNFFVFMNEFLQKNILKKFLKLLFHQNSVDKQSWEWSNQVKCYFGMSFIWSDFL